MRAHQLETILAFSCIGGWLAMRHGQKPAEFGEFDQGFGCRYKGGLEPNISPVELMIDENEPRPTFEWAKE